MKETGVFVLPACLHATRACVGQRPHDELNAKDPDVGKALHSGDVTTEALVK